MSLRRGYTAFELIWLSLASLAAGMAIGIFVATKADESTCVKAVAKIVRTR